MAILGFVYIDKRGAFVKMVDKTGFVAGKKVQVGYALNDATVFYTQPRGLDDKCKRLLDSCHKMEATEHRTVTLN